MKVLWLCNVMLPQVAVALNKPVSVFGGWLYKMAEELILAKNIDFSVCFPSNPKEQYSGTADALSYYTFSYNNGVKLDEKNIAEFEDVIRKVKPDVIHIFGTEFPHTLAMVKACQKCGVKNRIVISIQGLVSICARHYCAYLPHRVVTGYSFRDILFRKNIKKGEKNFIKKGICEIEALQNVKYIIGRTDWDEACVRQINPNAEYCFCNETLRDSFYECKWSIDECERHSIFVSQCSYPIKGFHLILEAFTEIKKRFPDAKLYTTGKDLVSLDMLGKIKETMYRRHLRKCIEKNDLKDSVIFLGELSEQEICKRFLNSNVFLSASSIENSPNSVGEAMILGVPTVSSDVGGVKNMLTHNSEGFIYPADEPYMIPYYVEKIFCNDELAKRFSSNAKEHAKVTHNKDENCRRLLEIYNRVIQEEGRY